MLAALKFFGRQPETADSDPASASPLASAPAAAPPTTPREVSDVKRIWFRDREPSAPTRIPSPRDDARDLLRWVAQAGYAGEPVLAEDLEKAYALMCGSLGRSGYPWQLVGEPLRELTGGRKEYTRIRLESGGPKKHRRRVYLIPNVHAQL
jgi:hypothetical protein